MTPVAGMKLPGRNSSGPAWPRIMPASSIRTPSASILTSSIVWPPMTTAGTSAVMIWPQRPAAVSKAARWAAVRPPRKRTSMRKAGWGAAVEMAEE